MHNVKNILFIITTPGGIKEENTIALVPADKLTLNELALLPVLDGKIINCDDDDETGWSGFISVLYKRFGLERQHVYTEKELKARRKDDPDFQQPGIIPIDLSCYLNPPLPFKVDKVVRIGWAI